MGRLFFDSQPIKKCRNILFRIFSALEWLFCNDRDHLVNGNKYPRPQRRLQDDDAIVNS